MTDEGQEPPIDGEGGGSFHIVQPHRDLESNWAVDLAKNLEDYLLKICSGEISGGDAANFSINFAEAALLLQGSIQVYSRKVEYLYSLVVRALEFLSQNRPQDQEDGEASQPEASTSRAVRNEDDDQFWCCDDIPVDAKNSLDSLSTKDALKNRLLKPPANLVVLEGDCLDSTGDLGELESYLLATHDLYREFILLDPGDAKEVDDYLKGDISGEGHYGIHKGSSLRSKGYKTFSSPVRQSGGTARKSTAKKKENNIDEPSAAPCGIDPDPAAFEIPKNNNFEYQMDDHHSEPDNFDDSDSDDGNPWKPLNPHEPGNLKVKPFRKVEILRKRTVRTKTSATLEFPLAKLDGPINPQLRVFWETHAHNRKSQQASEPLPYFEKLRQSLVDGVHETHGMFHSSENVNNAKDFDDGFEEPGFDMPGGDFGMDEDVDFNQEKHDDFVGASNDNVAENPEEISSQDTLEDLCRAHLDSVLASIAETEEQTEMAARVASWKQRIEHNLDEQDSRAPFDIHEYSERVLEKFSLEEGEDSKPFSEVVRGQPKHDIARTFSAMLQLVNDGVIDLEKPGPSGKSFCYTSVNPFYVQRLNHRERPNKSLFPQPKKRPNSSLKNKGKQADADQINGQPSVLSPPSSKSLARSPHQNGKFRAKKLGVPVINRCTPESKRRRKSRLVERLEPTDLHPAR